VKNHRDPFRKDRSGQVKNGGGMRLRILTEYPELFSGLIIYER
jgi:hypothetical protein